MCWPRCQHRIGSSEKDSHYQCVFLAGPDRWEALRHAARSYEVRQEVRRDLQQGASHLRSGCRHSPGAYSPRRVLPWTQQERRERIVRPERTSCRRHCVPYVAKAQVKGIVADALIFSRKCYLLQDRTGLKMIGSHVRGCAWALPKSRSSLVTLHKVAGLQQYCQAKQRSSKTKDTHCCSILTPLEFSQMVQLLK